MREMPRRTPSTVDAAFTGHQARKAVACSSALDETRASIGVTFSAGGYPALDNATIRSAVSTMIQTNNTVNPIYGPVEQWNTSEVTDMSKLFSEAFRFDADLSRWDTSNVTTMRYMFGNAEAFNSDLSAWDTSRVVDMMGMFAGATSFNKDLTLWNTSNVQTMANMFGGAEQFQGNVSGWDTSHVNNMSSMFSYASNFNGNISSWDTGSVTRMALMFSNATSFNGDLKHWNVSQVLNMQSMFENATSFKGDLSRWDTSNVVNTVKMFQGAVSFDSDLSYWDTQFLVHRRDMFTDATSFNGALSTRNASALQRDEWNTEGREFRKQAQTAAGRGSFVVRVTSEEQARVLLWSQAWNTFYDTRLAATRTLLDRLRGEGRLCVGEPDLSGIPFPENTEELRRMGVVFRLDSGQCISRYDVQLLLDRDDARVDKVLAPYGTSPAPVKRLTDVEKVGIGFLWAMSYSDNGAMKGEWPSEDDMTPPMDGWPDLVSMANDEKYVAQWYRLHETLRFQPFPDGDEREKPTQQELNERRQWTRTKETAQNRLRQEVTNIVRHSERQAQLLKMQQEKGILYQPSFRLPTPPLKITELVVPPTPKRPRPITATELTASLLQEQEDDASLRGNAVNQAVLTQINSNRTTYTLRIEHFGQTPQPEAEGEIVLRFASKPFRTAVNAMFGVPYSVEGRTKHCVSEEVKSGGDFVNANVVYKPIAIYEILNTMASSEYRQEMRKTRFANCSYRQEPVTCLTDSKFTGLMSESQGGAIDSSAPVNDKVLLHATSPSSVSSVLLNGLSDQYVAKFGSRYGKGIYFADVVCKNVRYSQPSTTRTDIDQLLNLTSSESARVRYMFVYRVTLGCAARYDQNMLSQQWESFRSTGVDRQPIYRPSTNGNEWNPPFTSLVINSYQNPQEHIMKNRDAARMLPVGLVAYEKTYVTSERAMGRVDRWW